MTARKTDINGYVEVRDNPISKVGVFPYLGRSISKELDPDHVYHVYRPEAELASQECIDSFKLSPWIDDHTMLGKGHTPAEDKGIHGVIGQDVYFKDGKLFANLKFFTDSLGQLINTGKRELSAGYRCAYEKASGVFNGQAYDFVQRKIRANHLALVGEGRMGPDVAVLDESDLFTFAFDTKELEMPEDNKPVMDAIEKLTGLVGSLVTVMDAKMKADEEKEKAAEDATVAAAKAALDAAKKGDNDEDKTKASMDAAIAPLITKIEGLAADASFKTVMGIVAKRDALVRELVPHIGAFDHSDWTVEDVAKYGVEKLSLPQGTGADEAILAGYLHGRDAPSPDRVLVFDAGISSSANSELADYIKASK